MRKYGVYNSITAVQQIMIMVRILKRRNVKLSYLPVLFKNVLWRNNTGGIGNYIISLKEAHIALKSNGVPTCNDN